MLPLVFLISPIKPCNKLVFPLPTRPTIATNIPLAISILMSLTWNTRSSSACNLAFSSWDFALAVCLEEWISEGNLLCFLVMFFPSSSSGGGVFQVNVAPLTWMATGRSSLTSCFISNNSASNIPESRPAALAASVMALKDCAVWDKLDCWDRRINGLTQEHQGKTEQTEKGQGTKNWRRSELVAACRVSDICQHGCDWRCAHGNGIVGRMNEK